MTHYPGMTQVLQLKKWRGNTSFMGLSILENRCGHAYE